MDTVERDRFTDDLLREAAKRYGVPHERLSLIGGFQNFIYEYQVNGQEYILRFTPQSHRTKSAVQAELEWVNYLAHHGISVSQPVTSTSENRLEVIQSKDSNFIVAAFDKAPGRKSGYPECLDDTKLYEQCGKMTGEMHNLARAYKPTSRRHDWRDNYYLKNLAKYVPDTQDKVHLACQKLMEQIDGLPKDRTSFGLIHGDINVGNFHVSDDGITLFDFDECQYSWYVEDIAIQLYYLVYVYGDDCIDDRMSQAKLFMQHFLKGYTFVCTIDEYWLRQIPLFLRLREIIVYVGMHRSWDLDTLDEWARDFIIQSKARIENGISIVDSTFFEQCVWN